MKLNEYDKERLKEFFLTGFLVGGSTLGFIILLCVALKIIVWFILSLN